jgi:hypothetical protein
MSSSQAQALFENGEYELAYESFKSMAENILENVEVRSDAYAMLGMIIFNIIDVEDGQAGLVYFRRALELKPDNIGALYNVVQTFYPPHHTYHNDKAFFMEAFNKLTGDLRDKVTERLMSEVLSKYENVRPYL